MPLSLARSSEWVRVNYNLATEPKGKTSVPRRVALLGRAIWKDPLNRRMAAGIGLVVAGVALVELGA